MKLIQVQIYLKLFIFVRNHIRIKTKKQDKIQTRNQAKTHDKSLATNHLRNEIRNQPLFNMRSFMIEESKEDNKLFWDKQLRPSCNDFAEFNRVPNHESKEATDKLCKTDNPIMNEKEDCAFCLDPMDNKIQRLVFLECAHKFHFNCLEEYKRVRARNNKVKCALWRREVRV